MSRLAATAVKDRLGGIDGRLRWFVSVPFRRRTYLNLAYLLLAFPLGLAYFVSVTVGAAFGLGLLILLVGGVILTVTLAVGLALAGFERWLTTRMLGIEIDPRTDLDDERRRDRLRSLLTDRKTWSALLYLPSKLVLGVASFSLAMTGLTTTMSMVLVPFYYDTPGLYVGFVSDRAPEFHPSLYVGWNYLLVGFETVVTIGHWKITTLPQALVVALVGALLLLVTLHALNGLARIWGRYATVMLGASYDPLAVLARRDR